jgi:hypothetical protein
VAGGDHADSVEDDADDGSSEDEEDRGGDGQAEEAERDEPEEAGQKQRRVSRLSLHMRCIDRSGALLEPVLDTVAARKKSLPNMLVKWPY